jgi:signal transduction histidine kinase
VSESAPRRWRSLTWRLTAAFLFTTLVIVVVLSVAVYAFTSFYLDERLDAELSAQANFYATYAAHWASDEGGLASLAPTVVTLFAPQNDLNVRFFAASNGALLAATQDLGPQPSREALMELRYRSPTIFTRPSLDLPQRRYEARPVVVGEGAIGVVEVSRSTLPIEQFLTTLQRILASVIVVAVAVSLLVSFLLALQLSRPIVDVERATQRIAAGDLDVRVADYPSNEIGRLAQSINQMAERLKSLEAARMQFIGEISHDLRTPLTAIKGLLVNLVDTAQEDQRSSLETAEHETDRLIRLVNQLLDFSRWEVGGLELNRSLVDIGEVATSAVSLSEARARHRGVTMQADIPADLPPVSGDRDRLQRVIINLLDNAIKFTPHGGEVTLSAAQKGEEVEVGVRDSGRGMSQKEVHKAFEPYYRGQGGGTGLGLAISKAIVEAHGGRMGIESKMGDGTRVWFTLPV